MMIIQKQLKELIKLRLLDELKSLSIFSLKLNKHNINTNIEKT